LIFHGNTVDVDSRKIAHVNRSDAEFARAANDFQEPLIG